MLTDDNACGIIVLKVIEHQSIAQGRYTAFVQFCIWRDKMKSAILRSVGRRLLTPRGGLAKAIAILCLVPVLLCISCDSTADKDAYKKIGLSCGAEAIALNKDTKEEFVSSFQAFYSDYADYKPQRTMPWRVRITHNGDFNASVLEEYGYSWIYDSVSDRKVYMCFDSIDDVGADMLLKISENKQVEGVEYLIDTSTFGGELYDIVEKSFSGEEPAGAEHQKISINAEGTDMTDTSDRDGVKRAIESFYESSQGSTLAVYVAYKDGFDLSSLDGYEYVSFWNNRESRMLRLELDSSEIISAGELLEIAENADILSIELCVSPQYVSGIVF